jgi:hypothetical protein
MQRMILGLIAASLLCGGLALWLLAPDSAGAIGLGMMRLGIMFAVVWLAIPNFTVIFAKFPPWLIFGTAAGLCVIAVRPRTIVLVGPILVLLWVIGPRWLSRKRNK